MRRFEMYFYYCIMSLVALYSGVLFRYQLGLVITDKFLGYMVVLALGPLILWLQGLAIFLYPKNYLLRRSDFLWVILNVLSIFLFWSFIPNGSENPLYAELYNLRGPAPYLGYTALATWVLTWVGMIAIALVRRRKAKVPD